MKQLLLFFVANIIIINISFSQAPGLAINNTSTVHNPYAMLDVSCVNSSPNWQGVLIPRISLANITDLSGFFASSPPVSLLVYNDGAAALTAGFYYWDGAQWVMIGAFGPTGITGASHRYSRSYGSRFNRHMAFAWKYRNC